MGKKERSSKVIRNGVRILVGIFIVIAGFFWASKWWMPKAIEWGAKHYGLKIEEIGRLEPGYVALKTISGAIDDWEVKAEEIQIPTPGWWLVNVLQGESAPLIAKKIKVIKGEEKEAKESDSLEMEEIREAIKELHKTAWWLLFLDAEIDEVEIAFDEETVKLKDIRWRQHQLSGDGSWVTKDEIFKFSVDFPVNDSIRGEVEIPKEKIKLSGTATVFKKKINLNASGTWNGNKVILKGKWGESWVPEELKLSAKDADIPEKYVKIKGYKDVKGDIQVNWKDEAYGINVDLKAESEKGEKPLKVAIEGEGKGNKFQVKQLGMDTPWAKSSGKEKGEITFNINLDSIGFLPLNGEVKAVLKIQEQEEGFPIIELNGEGIQITYNGYRFDSLNLVGKLDWPEVSVEKLSIAGKEDGTAFEASGVYHILERKIVKSHINGTIGGKLAKKISPIFSDIEVLKIEKGSVAGSLKGFPTDVIYSGKCSFKNWVLNESIKLEDGSLEVRGKGHAVEAYVFETTSGKYKLKAGGNATWAKDRIDVTLKEGVFQETGKEPFNLKEASKVTIRFKDGEFEIEGSPFSLVDKNGKDLVSWEIKLNSEYTGTIKLRAEEGFLEFTKGYIRALDKLKKFGEVHFKELVIDSTLKKGSVEGQLSLESDLALEGGIVFKTSLKAMADEKTIKLNGTGLRNRLKELTFQGSVDNPEGLVKKVIKEKKMPFKWDSAELKGKFDQVPVEIFQGFLPNWVRPQGTLDIELTKAKGSDIEGVFDVSNGATYPLPGFGPARDIGTKVYVSKDEAFIESMQATVGRRTVTLQGIVNYKDWETPIFDLQLHAEDFPLVRTPKLTIRGNVDLAVRTDKKKTTTLDGLIQLTEGYFLVDIRNFYSSGTSTTLEGPAPYFSIETEPFSSWKLDVDIKGKDFLKVQTPLARTTGSANFNLKGTLKDPIGIGHLSFNQGQITFPFGTLDIKRGNVSLTESDYETPNLDVLAEGTVYDYDVALRIKGTSDEPEVEFSSSPSLDTGQIITMLTTGTIPDDRFSRTATSRLGALGVYFSRSFFGSLGLGRAADKLRIKIGEDITESGQDTVEVEYQFNDKWSAIGEYDQFDAYNLDIKRELYSR